MDIAFCEGIFSLKYAIQKFGFMESKASYNLKIIIYILKAKM